MCIDPETESLAWHVMMRNNIRGQAFNLKHDEPLAQVSKLHPCYFLKNKFLSKAS